MAKLPDINYNRGVPTLHSSKAAALPGKLREINAKVQGITAGVATGLEIVDTAFEKEAKLDANRRYQRAQREFTEEHTALVQEYHTSNKPLDQFASDLDSLRRKSFDLAGKDMGARGDKYLGPKLDQFRSAITTSQVKTMQVLAESRSIQHMEMANQDNLAMLRDNPTSGGVVIALDNMDDMLVDNGLSTAQNQESRAKMTTGIFRETVSKMLLNGDYEAAIKLTKRAAWNDMPQASRLTLESAIHKESLTAIDTHTAEVSNALITGESTQLKKGEQLDTDVLWNEIDAIPGLIETNTLLEGTTAEDMARTSQGEMAYNYLFNQAKIGNEEQVRAELISGDYDKILSPAQTRALSAAAQEGAATKDMNRHIERAGLMYVVDQTATALVKDPTTSDTSVGAAFANLEAIAQSYYANGEAPPREVETARLRLVQAQADAHTTLDIWRDPGQASRHLSSIVGNDPAAVHQRAVVEEAIESRAKHLATDAVTFADKIGMDAPPLPAIGSENYAAALSHRFDVHTQLENTFGTDISGPLSAGEVDDLMVWLTQKGPDGVLAYAGSLQATVGYEGSDALWNQLNKTDDNSLLPVAGRMANRDMDVQATNMLIGEQWLNDSKSAFKPTELTKVKAGIREELGQAFGEDSLAAARHQKAALAYYTYLLGAPETRGDFSYDSGLAEAAVQAVTGGTLQMNGRTVVAPAKGVEQYDLDRWRDNLRGDSIPPVLDATGAIIPARDIEDGLDRTGFGPRYQLVEQGTPGTYYIMDSRSLNAGGTAGAFLYDGSEGHKKGALATIRYNPTLSVNPRRRSRY